MPASNDNQMRTATGAPVADRDVPPDRHKVVPSVDDLKRVRLTRDVNLQELDGPEDLDKVKDSPATRSRLPSVSWPASDADAPDFAHLEPEGREPKIGDPEFDIGPEELELLARANGFEPTGYDDRFVFAFRGAEIVGKNMVESVDRVRLKEVRPNHADFRCTIGYYSRRTKKLSAFRASTVPNVEYMTNYYKKKNDIGDYTSTEANMLPTGCYIYRVGGHSSNKIYPALRMTNPENLADDGEVTTLRTFNDLTFKADDLWDKTKPYDNIHCAYWDDKFSSAGCQVIQGADGEGPWGRFQSVLKALRPNTRLDYMLLTGREASIASYLRSKGQDGNAEIVTRYLGRMRHGTYGEAVKRLQKRLGTAETGYFGPKTKLVLTEFQKKNNLRADGIYAPALEARLGWDVMKPAPPAAPVAPPAPVAAAPVTPAPSPVVPQPMPAPALATSPVPAAATATAVAAAAAVAPPAPPSVPPPPEMGVAPSPPPPTPPAPPPPVMATPVPLPAAPPPPPMAPPAPVAAAPQPVPQPSPVPRPDPVAAPAPVASPAPPAQPAAPLPPLQPIVVPAGAVPQFTPELLRRFAPRALPQYTEAMLKGNDLLTRYGINQTPHRFCHFLGQIGNECGRLTILEENMNYTSASRIQAIWPSRFPTLDAAEPFVRNPQGLAEKVYNGRLGNDRPGDGWLFRGRGLVQITGRGSYREMGRKLGIPLEENPDLACDPEHALKIACETWMSKQLAGERDMNRLADVNKLEAMTYRINGGYTNIGDRQAAFEQAWKIWGTGEAPKSALESDVLDRGDRGDRVDHLNDRLDDLGLFAGITDKRPQQVYSISTYKALRNFQQAQGLTQTGVCTADTWLALDKPLKRGAPPARDVRRGPAGPAEPSRTEEGLERARQRVRAIRSWAIFLTLAALAFAILYTFALITPGRLGDSSLWMPYVFAGLVALGALVTWSWSRTIESSDLEGAIAREKATTATRSASAPAATRSNPGMPRPSDEEPVRRGVNLDPIDH